ncbi:MAG: Mini-ribonuclease 3 [Firmicutes bacterium]|nr:Mini-ribonuclease 3 [Bacillota bacterium]
MNIKPKDMNTTALAFLGDAVYEVYARKHVMETGEMRADKLHRMAVKYVCADGQAKAVKSMINDFLTEEEIRLVKRARNHKTTSKARSADPVTYKLATAFEALVGYLELAGDKERLEMVVAEALKRIEE